MIYSSTLTKLLAYYAVALYNNEWASYLCFIKTFLLNKQSSFYLRKHWPSNPSHAYVFQEINSIDK